MLKIELEGCDGCGKSTAAKYLISQAKKRGLKVVETREVGNPHVAACTKMREFVLDPNNNLTGKTMEFIFSAMRYENDKWFNDLKNSKNPPDLVISDRGFISHVAYTDHNVSEEFTNQLYYGILEQDTQLPDIIIYFNVDTETALRRRVKRGEKEDAIEIKGIKFQEKVKESFEKHLAIFEQNEKTGIVYDVDANQELHNVQAQLDDILTNIINSSLFNEKKE